VILRVNTARSAASSRAGSRRNATPKAAPRWGAKRDHQKIQGAGRQVSAASSYRGAFENCAGPKDGFDDVAPSCATGPITGAANAAAPFADPR